MTIIGEVEFGGGTTFGATAVLVDDATARAAFAPGRSGQRLPARGGRRRQRGDALRAAVAKVLPADCRGHHRHATFNEENQKAARDRARLHHDVPAGLRRHRAVRRRRSSSQHVLDAGRPAHARARPAARRRRLPAARSRRVVLGEAFVDRPRRLGGRHRVRRARGRRGEGRAARPSSASTCRPDLPVGAEHRRREPPRRHSRDDGRGVAAGLARGADRTRRRDARRPVDARRRACGLRGSLGADVLVVGAALVVVGVTRDDIAWLLGGLGALLVVLGAIVAAPVIARPVDPGRRGAVRRVPRRRRQARPGERAAGPPAHGHHRQRADDRARADRGVSASSRSRPRRACRHRRPARSRPTSCCPAAARVSVPRLGGAGRGEAARASSRCARAPASEVGPLTARTSPRRRARPRGCADNVVLTMRSGTVDALDRGKVLGRGDHRDGERAWTTGSTVRRRVGTLTGQRLRRRRRLRGHARSSARDCIVDQVALRQAAVPAGPAVRPGRLRQGRARAPT